jgi:benzoyl-CoA 2,3-epoxidase subunit A
MNAPAEAIQQHLIDPEICIRCNTCEATCPVGAITHDSRNYVVDAAKCNLCMACVPPCPTGSIDNWRTVLKAQAYTVQEQLGWDVLPQQQSVDAPVSVRPASVRAESVEAGVGVGVGTGISSTEAPWSAETPQTNLFTAKTGPATATVVGNLQVNEAGTKNQTHHIVLDFGDTHFPVLEGQSLGIVAPGVDAQGKPHAARQYSIASARNGERSGYNNLSLTVKRVTSDHEGNPVRGVASNYLCDLKLGDMVQVIGPFGTSFLMPNHPGSHVVMICTGTGSAPMRGMTEWRRRQRRNGFHGGKLMLFFGARTQQELPYFGPLQNLPKDFIDIHLAFSRTPGAPKTYVQDKLRERAADLAPLLSDPNAYFYVCGLKAMEEGVVMALRDVAQAAGLDWSQVNAALKRQGRLHLETY